MQAQKKCLTRGATGPGNISLHHVNKSTTIPSAAPADKLLPRLDKLRPNGNVKWMACCPAHEDRSPSLSIKECPDGTILVKCFAGCTARDITAAVGLELRDLFPPKPYRLSSPSDGLDAKRRREIRKVLAQESFLIRFARAAQKSGENLSEEDAKRILLADERARKAREALGYE